MDSDFSVLANTVKLTNNNWKVGHVRFRNLKVPSGSGDPGTTVTPFDITLGAHLEILNYGEGDTNHRFWIQDSHGHSMAEVPSR